jgi:hypothetical protein
MTDLDPVIGGPAAGRVRSTSRRGAMIDIDDEPRGRLLSRGAA